MKLKLLLEILSQYRYDIPKKDPEELLFDFYMFFFIDTYDPVKYGKQIIGYRSEQDELNVEKSIKETRAKLLSYLKDRMLRDVYEAIMSEMDNFGLTAGDGPHEKKNDIGDRLAKFQMTSFTILGSLRTIKDGTKRKNIIEILKTAFSKLHWTPGYGGEAWANICDAWLKLYDAKTTPDLYIWIDHIYDIEHNTGSIFKKVDSYDVGGSYTWLYDALELKSRATPSQLLTYCSSSMRELAAVVLKAKEIKYQYVPKYEQTKLNSQLILAIRSENLEKVKELIAGGADVNHNYRQSLRIAVTLNHEEIAKYLLENGISKIDVMNLREAAGNGNVKIFDLLVKHGGKLDDYNSSTIIDMAINSKKFDFIKYFITKYDVSWGQSMYFRHLNKEELLTDLAKKY